MDRLPEIGVRTLLVGGRYASHLCFAEQPEEFNRVINSFMT